MFPSLTRTLILTEHFIVQSLPRVTKYFALGYNRLRDLHEECARLIPQRRTQNLFVSDKSEEGVLAPPAATRQGVEDESRGWSERTEGKRERTRDLSEYAFPRLEMYTYTRARCNAPMRDSRRAWREGPIP